ncbi:MAG: AI-2E family transporter [Candidatus Saccharimonadales bacterium]
MLHIGRRKTDPETIAITISNRTVLRVLILAILSFIFLSMVRSSVHTLTMIFTAFFLALALNVPVHWLASKLPGKHKGSRTWATSIAFFIIVAVISGFLASIVPPLVKQTSNFINEAPALIEDIRSDNSDLGKFVRRYHLQDQTNKISDEIAGKSQKFSDTALTSVQRIGGSIFSTLTVLVLTFMMLIEGPRWLLFARRLVSEDNTERFDKITHDMYKVITGYVNGQVTLAALASVMILIPLLLFHVSYPLALMVIVFICGLIPLVGHTIGAVIVSTVALFHSPYSALGVLIYYIAYQQIENYGLQPKIQANSTNMSPLLVFGSVIIGVNFGGLFGGLMAIPIAGCLRIIILDYLDTRKMLSPETSLPGTPVAPSAKDKQA